MDDFPLGLFLGFVLATFIGVFIGFGPLMDSAKETRLQRKCLYPVLDKSFIAEPYTKTCYSLMGDMKTVIDCKTVLLLPEFSNVKSCF